MKSQNLNEIFVAIDIGTTKICTLVAKRSSNDNLEILAVGKAPSFGLAKGVVVDIPLTIESIKASLLPKLNLY